MVIWRLGEAPKPASASWDGTKNRVPSRLGSSLHLKGEISGNEDLDINGSESVYSEAELGVAGLPLSKADAV